MFGNLGFQRVDIEAGVVRPQILLQEAHDVEGLESTAALGVVAAPRFVLRNHPLRSVFDDDPRPATGERLSAGMEQRGAVLHRDAITNCIFVVAHAFVSDRARTSSIFAVNSSGVMRPLLISTLAATVAHRA